MSLPLPAMREKCFDKEAAEKAPSGAYFDHSEGADRSKVITNKEDLQWMMGEIQSAYSDKGSSTNTPLDLMMAKCYDKDRDGRGPTQFHKGCNYKGQTVALIELKNGKKIAVFNADQYTSRSGYIQVYQNALMSITERISSTAKDRGYWAMYHSIYDQAAQLIYQPFGVIVSPDVLSVTLSNPGHSYNMWPKSTQQLIGGDGSSNKAYIKHLEVWTLGRSYKTACAGKGPTLTFMHVKVRRCKLDPNLKAPPGFQNLILKRITSLST